jgi:DNA-directed RNA polymerase subunit RPC12/RpoP
MAEFKCKNCDNIFNKFCDTINDSINVACPICGSHWVEIYYTIPKEEFNPFQKLPNSSQRHLRENGYKFWRDFININRIMNNCKPVRCMKIERDLDGR